MAAIEMVVGTLVLFLCLMPLVFIYGGFTILVSHVIRFNPTTRYPEPGIRETWTGDLVMTVTPVLPTIFVGYFWHTRFCYDLLMAPLVFPYQDVFRWVWFIGLVVFVFMIMRMERRIRRTAMGGAIEEIGKRQNASSTESSIHTSYHKPCVFRGRCCLWDAVCQY